MKKKITLIISTTSLLMFLIILLSGCTDISLPELSNEFNLIINDANQSTDSEFEWFSIEPRQCKTNPWDKWQETNSVQYSIEPSQEQIIKDYFNFVHSIEVKEFTSIKTEEIVCMACTCPTGKTYYVLVSNKYNKQMIELGWSIVNGNPNGFNPTIPIINSNTTKQDENTTNEQENVLL